MSLPHPLRLLSPSLLWLLAALAAGLLLAPLSPAASLALIASVVAVALAVLEPAFGLGLAVLLGPIKALVEFSRSGLIADVGDLYGALPLALRHFLDLVPSDLGQLFFALAVAGWLARGLAQRRLEVPWLPLTLPLAVFIGLSVASLIGAPDPVEGLKEVAKWLQILLALYIVRAEALRHNVRSTPPLDARRSLKPTQPAEVAQPFAPLSPRCAASTAGAPNGHPPRFQPPGREVFNHRLSWLVALILLAGVVQAGIGYWQYALRGIGPSHFAILGGHYRAYGTFEQPNPFGGFLGLLWPLAAGLAVAAVRLAWQHPRPRTLALAGLLGAVAGLMLLGLYISFSRGAWLGAAAAALALAITLPRRLRVGAVLVGAGLLAGAVLLNAGLLPASLTSRLADVGEFTNIADVRGETITVANFAIVERLAHWQAAVYMAQDHPWLGVGLGNYAAAYPRYALLNWPNALGHAHMIYLNLLAEVGVVGLAAYLCLWLVVFALTMRTLGRVEGLWRGLAVGLLGTWTHLSVHQLVDSLYVNNIHLLLAVLLGLLLALPSGAGPGLERAAD